MATSTCILAPYTEISNSDKTGHLKTKKARVVIFCFREDSSTKKIDGRMEIGARQTERQPDRSEEGIKEKNKKIKKLYF